MVAPLAFAGPDQRIEPNTPFGLVAKGYDNNIVNGSGHWIPRASHGNGVFTQVSGVTVPLTRVVTGDGIVYTGTTPAQSTTQTLVFRLTITADSGETATDDVTLTVPPKQT